MSKVLFINDSFPSDLEDICEYQNFRPTPTEVFSADFTFNQFANKRLAEIFNQNKYELIILPYNLSEGNYMSFTGISIALHIRLSPEWKHQKTPILFIGPESIDEILKFAPNPHIFSTSGIFTTRKRSKEEIKKQIDWIIEPKHKLTISDIEYDIFLAKINLIPPEFYDNRHSIANEWALLLLDSISRHNVLVEKPELQEIRSSLYIKWLMVKNKVELPTNEKPPNDKGFIIPNTQHKRVLLIEDEWNKGWLDLYRAFFGDNGDECKVDYLKIQKGDKKSDILRKLKPKLNEDWDLFLLDIRLTDDDHNSENHEEYSGFKVLEEIKKTNKGYQVILTSASNKQWIYDYGRNIGADEIILKPDISSHIIDENWLEQSLKKPILASFKRSYLVKLYSFYNVFRSTIDYTALGNDLEKIQILNLQNKLLNHIELAISILTLDIENAKELSLVTLFRLFELINEYFIDEDNESRPGALFFTNGEEIKYFKWSQELRRYKAETKNSQIKKYQYQSTENKMRAFCFQKLNKDNSCRGLHKAIHEICISRNKYIHEGNTNISITKIIKWFNDISVIFCKI